MTYPVFGSIFLKKVVSYYFISNIWNSCDPLWTR